MSNIKPYNTLNSDEKKGRRTFGYSSCVNCFAHKKGICNETIYDVCCNAYTRGFVAGTKKHRELIKEEKLKLKNKRSKICNLTDEDIRLRLLKYFENFNFGYIADIPLEDIIDYLNSKKIMTDYIIVWYDNDAKDFNNDNYECISKTEAIKRFYHKHDSNAVIINIIEI